MLIHVSLLQSSLFSVENFLFDRKTFNSIVGVFFDCLEIAHDAQSLQNCAESLVSCILHASGVTAFWETEVAGLNPTIRHPFYSLQILANAFLLLNNKN